MKVGTTKVGSLKAELEKLPIKAELQKPARIDSAWRTLTGGNSSQLVSLPMFGYVVSQGILVVWFTEQSLDTEQYGPYLQGRAPFFCGGKGGYRGKT